MTNHGASDENRRDEVWQGLVNWDLGVGGSHVSPILWRCDALRAGKLYNRSMFGSREEAEHFAQRMREAEPDQIFNVESIRASQVWN
jgi:hypothetical protein